jgi:hypothetical protein
MTIHQVIGTQSHGNSIQFNDSIHGNVILPELPAKLQTSFFKTADYLLFKNDPNPDRVPGTCKWFLDHPGFQRWKESRSADLLWLSADPGCGKSVLSKALIDDKLLSDRPATICYFFFKDNAQQDNVATAFCALLHQFFSKHNGLLQKHAASAVEKDDQFLKQEFESLWEIFLSAATDPSAGDVVCVLDALDECGLSDRQKLIGKLKYFYNSTRENLDRKCNLKFLVTSRPYREIELKFSDLVRNFPTIRLAGEEESTSISAEIGLVIKRKVSEIAANRGLEDRVRSALEAAFLEIPNRTYLWLTLILDEVEKARSKTEKELIGLLNHLPRTIYEAYEKILKRCAQDEKCMEDARRILRLIVAARRPLTVSEIDVALEIRPESSSYEDLGLQGVDGRKEWIRASCGLFVRVVDSRVFLIHQTAREFLLRGENEILDSKSWRHSIDLQDAHRELSKICITHLFFQEFQAAHSGTHFQRSRDLIKRIKEVQKDGIEEETCYQDLIPGYQFLH